MNTFSLKLAFVISIEDSSNLVGVNLSLEELRWWEINIVARNKPIDFAML